MIRNRCTEIVPDFSWSSSFEFALVSSANSLDGKFLFYRAEVVTTVAILSLRRIKNFVEAAYKLRLR